MAITITVLPAASISVNPVVPATITINPNLPSVGASVEVGTTTTGAPGTDALVVNSGTPTAVVLDFTIPRGEQGVVGATGPTGPQGPTGAAATIVVGTTTTLPAGSSASVTNIGTTSNAIFNFAIPQGATGAPGTSGVVYATAPLAYDSGTKTISIDLSTYATKSYVTSQGYITSSALSPYLTSSTAASTYYPLTNPSGYITSSALSPYLLATTASTTYAPIAAKVPTGGTTGQVLAKTSGSDYATSWQTPAVGDKYYTTSTTSLSVSNGIKTLTVATGLSYTTQQDIIIAYDATHHMHAVVVSYNTSTGVLVADVSQHTGTGTYSLWTVNVGGISSVAEWGLITGTLSNQTDLQSALDAKLAVTTAASTYQPIGSYLTDAPSDGTPYVRQDGAWLQLIIS